MNEIITKNMHIYIYAFCFILFFLSAKFYEENETFKFHNFKLKYL